MEEVGYRNEADEVTLAGTLTRPPGQGPFPAAVLLTVAGPNDRDQTHSGHKPFAVLADHLTRAGFAVLRTDDRGVGGSTGELFSSTLDDLGEDALAAVAFLRSRPDIDPQRVGLIGNSEGAAVAALAAVCSDVVAFVVMLAEPGLRGTDAIRLQQVRLAEQQGFTREEALALDRRMEDLFAVVLDENLRGKDQRLRELLRRSDVRLPATVALAGGDPDAQVRLYLSPWYMSQLRFDPTAVLRRVDVPALAVTGDRDPFLPADVHLPAIREVLQAGGNPDVTVCALP